MVSKLEFDKGLVINKALEQMGSPDKLFRDFLKYSVRQMTADEFIQKLANYIREKEDLKDMELERGETDEK